MVSTTYLSTKSILCISALPGTGALYVLTDLNWHNDRVTQRPIRVPEETVPRVEETVSPRERSVAPRASHSERRPASPQGKRAVPNTALHVIRA